MELLFVHGSSRWIHDTDGNLYLSTNFNEEIWKRYHKHTDTLSVLLRKDDKKYPEDIAQKRFNRFDRHSRRSVEVPDVYKSFSAFLSLRNRMKLRKTINESVKKADYIIIRSFGNIYTYLTYKYAKKNNKPFLIEVTGFEFEADWFHSFKGKLVALPRELLARKMLSNTDYAIYVTKEALQSRYPCKGESIGCSDVEVEISEITLANRLKHIESINKLVLGTAASLDVGWKGQVLVLKALQRLSFAERKLIEYQLVGAGCDERLRYEIKRRGLSDCVKIIGELPHNKIYEWMDSIDVYIQPSYMEGLCRSIVEAMSRGCPVICSDVGGNRELIEKEYIFKPGSIMEIVKLIEMVRSKDKQKSMAKRNFEIAKGYETSKLDSLRDEFLYSFCGR